MTKIVVQKKRIILLIVMVGFSLFSLSQENYKGISKSDSVKTFSGGGFYVVKNYQDIVTRQKPKNIIFMIGDGMGMSQVFAGMTANGNHLFLENFKHIGFSKTQSADNYITDSAAGGTALSCGIKTYNGAIGVNIDTVKVENIREIAEIMGKATGVVSTSAITHATPASYMAHQGSRASYEDIAADFLNTKVDVFIGGGYKHFSDRKDGRNLIAELKQKGYQVLLEMDSIKNISTGKLAGLTALEHNDRISIRKDMLQVATQTALNILNNDKDGFFLMVEGSQIDWGGHQNNTRYVVEEMLDFDKTIGVALEFASRNKETLIVVTADHETGGMSLVGGDFNSGMVKGAFSTGNHTAVMVPVFAFGPEAEEFTGFMENTAIAKKLIKLIQK